MLNSKRVKLFGIVGTFSIISTAYILHAKTFYTELYPTENKITNILILDKPKEKILDKPKEKINNKLEIAKIKIVKPSEKLNQILKKHKYIYIDEFGKISENSKEILTKIIPLLSDLNDSYIEIEGHSSSLMYDYLTQKRSKQSAQIVYDFIAKSKIDKDVILTGYGDLYPIIDDKFDKRNSRVEIKIRRR